MRFHIQGAAQYQSLAEAVLCDSYVETWLVSHALQNSSGTHSVEQLDPPAEEGCVAQMNYDVSCDTENQTTGQALQVEFATAIEQTLGTAECDSWSQYETS